MRRQNKRKRKNNKNKKLSDARCQPHCDWYPFLWKIFSVCAGPFVISTGRTFAVDLHSIQPPPAIVCECLIPPFFFSVDVVVGHCFHDIAHFKKVLAIKHHFAIVLYFFLIHHCSGPTVTHILLRLDVYFESAVPDILISSYRRPHRKKVENVLVIQFYGEWSVCAQVRCQVRHMHIVCLIICIDIYIYTSIGTCI